MVNNKCCKGITLPPPVMKPSMGEVGDMLSPIVCINDGYLLNTHKSTVTEL